MISDKAIAFQGKKDADESSISHETGSEECFFTIVQLCLFQFHE